MAEFRPCNSLIQWTFDALFGLLASGTPEENHAPHGFAAQDKGNVTYIPLEGLSWSGFRQKGKISNNLPPINVSFHKSTKCFPFKSPTNLNPRLPKPKPPQHQQAQQPAKPKQKPPQQQQQQALALQTHSMPSCTQSSTLLCPGICP